MIYGDNNIPKTVFVYTIALLFAGMRTCHFPNYCMDLFNTKRMIFLFKEFYVLMTSRLC